VIDSLCDQALDGSIAVAGLYCDSLAQKEQTINNIIGAILKQLVGLGDIPHDVRKVFQMDRRFGGRGRRLGDSMRMLRTAIASLPQVFICIDALDECLPRYLRDLLECLKDIVRESPNTRIFLTGRPTIRGDFQRYFAGVVVIPISPNMEDIRNYLDMRLDMDEEQDEAMDNDLRADIVRTIIDKMSDV